MSPADESPKQRQTSLPYERDEQLRLIAAASRRLRAGGCFTRIQINRAEDLMTAIVLAPRNEDDETPMEVLAAQARLSVRRAHTVLAFAEHLKLITVKRSAGPRRPNRFYVDFDTLRGLEASEKVAERSAEIAERCVETAERSAALELQNDMQKLQNVLQHQSAERSATFAISARSTSKHEHEHVKHEHVPPAQAACSMLADKGLEGAQRTLAAELAAHLRRKQAAEEQRQAKCEPQRIAAVLPAATPSKPSHDGSGVTSQRTPPRDLAAELSALIDEPKAPPAMFRDVAAWVRGGALSRDAVIGIATSLRETRGRTKPIRNRGGAFRAEVRKILPAAIAESLPANSPWRERPESKPSGYG